MPGHTGTKKKHASPVDVARVAHSVLFIVVAVAVWGLSPVPLTWPWFLLVPLLGYAVIVLPFGYLRRSLTWLRWGSLDHVSWLLVAGTAVAGVLGLWLWAGVGPADLSSLAAGMPEMPRWLVPAAALGFACLNASLEEAAFRGLLQDSLFHATRRPRVALVA